MARKTDQATAYAKAVVAGKVIAGKPVRLACERHLRNIKNAKALGLEWRPDKAQLAIEFFADVLVLEDERPFVLEPFQAFIVGSCFGWYNADGFRRFRDAYVEMGKGSGKSPLAGGIGLYGLIADDEPAAEVYSAATTQDQAKIVWKDADRMVTQSAELRGAIKQEAACLTYVRNGVESVFRPVSSEHRGLDGKRVHIGLIDELHEHANGMVVDKIRAGTKRRKNALVFRITNSGHDRHSVCWNEHEYSLKVLDGIIDNESWFAYVCALDEGDKWTNEKVWPKTNPGMSVGLPPVTYLREQVASAVGMPSKENLVRRLNFCEWTETSVRTIPLEEWDRPSACIPVDMVALRGRRCFGGLDLARVSDLSAFVLLFPPEDEDELLKLLCWFWVPKEDIGKRSLRDRVPYDVWERQGFITATPGNTTDFGFIESKIIELAGLFSIEGVRYDRTFAGEIVQALLSEGVPMIEFGQGFLSLAAPTAELLRLVKAGGLQHGGNPVMRWMASNLSVATDAAGNMKPDKEHSAEKIDGIAATCNALGGVLVAEPPAANESWAAEWA